MWFGGYKTQSQLVHVLQNIEKVIGGFIFKLCHDRFIQLLL